MFPVVNFGRYVIVHAICHVSLNVRMKREKKKDNIESLGRLCSDGLPAAGYSEDC